MKYLRQIWRGGKIASLVLAGWLAAHGAALAQGPQQQKPSGPQVGSGVYVFAYFIVILGVALGFMAACISSRRRDRARPEQYEVGKLTAVEEKK
jgi:hypothetical protein